MFNFVNLLDPVSFYKNYKIISIVLIILMALAAIAAIILVLMQPANSSGIDALGGSSETFYGKNKGKSTEAKMRRWTWICLAVLVVLAITFYVIPNVIMA